MRKNEKTENLKSNNVKKVKMRVQHQKLELISKTKKVKLMKVKIRNPKMNAKIKK